MANSSYDELITILKHLLLNKFAPKPSYVRGVLGDGTGKVEVPGRKDHDYARFNRGSSEAFEVFNKEAPSVDGWPVLIGEFPWMPGLTQVVGTDWSAYEQSGWGDSVTSNDPHAPTHEWPDGAPGADPVSIYTRAIVPLRAYVAGTGSTTIYVNAYEYDPSGTVWGGNPGVNLQPIMGVTSTGTMRYAGIYLDVSTNTLGVVTGSTTVHSSALTPPLVSFPTGQLPSARIRIYGGQATITEADIVDARRLFTPYTTAGGSGSAVAPPYGKIHLLKTDGTVDEYTDLGTALDDLAAGELAWMGPGSFSLTAAKTILDTAALIGSGRAVTTITSSNLDNTLTIQSGGMLGYCKVERSGTVTAADVFMIKTSNTTANRRALIIGCDLQAFYNDTGAFYRATIELFGATWLEDNYVLVNHSIGSGSAKLRGIVGDQNGASINFDILNCVVETNTASGSVADSYGLERVDGPASAETFRINGGYFKGDTAGALLNFSGVTVMNNVPKFGGGITLSSGTIEGPYLNDNGTLTMPDSSSKPPLNVTERSAEPSSPATNDIYMDDGTNTASGSPGWRRYNGAAWEDIGATAGNAVGENLLYHSLTHSNPLWMEGTTFNDPTDDTYVGDLWNFIWDTNAPDVTGQIAGSSDPFTRYLRVTHDANSQAGIVQFLATQDTRALRGKTVSLSADLWGTGVSTLRMAVLEWSGTADAVTSDVVGTWSTGNPTLAANWTYIGTPAAISITGTRARYSVENLSISATVANLAVFIWTDAVEVNTDLWNVARVKLEIGSTATEPDGRSLQEELGKVFQFVQILDATNNTVNLGVGSRFSTTNITSDITLRGTMRSAPSFSHNITGYSASAPGTTTIGLINFTANGFFTITGALTVSSTASSKTVIRLQFTAGTSWSGANGDISTMRIGPSVVAVCDSRL